MYIPFIPSNLSYLIFENSVWQIAEIVPNVVIREVHDDELTITDHLVGVMSQEVVCLFNLVKLEL